MFGNKRKLLLFLSIMILMNFGTIVILNSVVAQSLESRPSPHIITANQNANARLCPETRCNVLTTFSPGQSVTVIETVEGESIEGDNQWRRIFFEGKEVYVYSRLTRPDRSFVMHPNCKDYIVSVPQTRAYIDTRPRSVYVTTYTRAEIICVLQELTNNWATIDIDGQASTPEQAFVFLGDIQRFDGTLPVTPTIMFRPWFF